MTDLDSCDDDRLRFMIRANKILIELLSTEFKNVKKTVRLRWPQKWTGYERILSMVGGIACVDRIFNLYHPHEEHIIFNPRFKDWLFNDPDFAIRELLRHELLHIELDKDDEDPEFIKEARRRGVHWASMSEKDWEEYQRRYLGMTGELK